MKTTDELYAEYVRLKAGSTEMYNDVLDDLLSSPNLKNIHRAKDENDYATIEIGTHRLAKYIVQLVNDMVSHVGKREGREESEDAIRDDIGLGKLKKYDKNIQEEVSSFHKTLEEYRSQGLLSDDE